MDKESVGLSGSTLKTVGFVGGLLVGGGLLLSSSTPSPQSPSPTPPKNPNSAHAEHTPPQPPSLTVNVAAASKSDFQYPTKLSYIGDIPTFDADTHAKTITEPSNAIVQKISDHLREVAIQENGQPLSYINITGDPLPPKIIISELTQLLEAKKTGVLQLDSVSTLSLPCDFSADLLSQEETNQINALTKDLGVYLTLEGPTLNSQGHKGTHINVAFLSTNFVTANVYDTNNNTVNDNNLNDALNKWAQNRTAGLPQEPKQASQQIFKVGDKTVRFSLPDTTATHSAQASGVPDERVVGNPSSNARSTTRSR